MAFLLIPAGLNILGVWAGINAGPATPEQQCVRPGQICYIPVGSIGWTQDSVSPRVYNVTSGERIPLRHRVAMALNDPRGAATHLREAFPDPITVFDNGRDGLLSLDNRRLTIFRLALPSHTRIPVRIVTREEAGHLLQMGRDCFNPREALAQRLTTRDGGYSIIIRGDRSVISQGVSYIPSPYVQANYTHDEL